MTSHVSWKVPAASQPKIQDYHFDLERALSSVVVIHCTIPPDAYTAETLGVDRSGNGVLIDKGLILTIGYLIAEAETVWVHLGDGQVIEGFVLGMDQESGFGLVQTLANLDIQPITIGDSDSLLPNDEVIVGGAGGRSRSIATRVFTREDFAGYWEYFISDAIFTTPSHPNWGGAALISGTGELVGLGSLQIERENNGSVSQLNMNVPINLLPPLLSDIRRNGWITRPPRPWLGAYATELDGRVVLVGIAPRSPAARADMQTGDIILGINGRPVHDLGDFYQRLWASGPAGVEVNLILHRGGNTFNVKLKSDDRTRYLRKPRLH